MCRAELYDAVGWYTADPNDTRFTDVARQLGTTTPEGQIFMEVIGDVVRESFLSGLDEAMLLASQRIDSLCEQHYPAGAESAQSEASRSSAERPTALPAEPAEIQCEVLVTLALIRYSAAPANSEFRAVMLQLGASTPEWTVFTQLAPRAVRDSIELGLDTAVASLSEQVLQLCQEEHRGLDRTDAAEAEQTSEQPPPEAPEPPSDPEAPESPTTEAGEPAPADPLLTIHGIDGVRAGDTLIDVATSTGENAEFSPDEFELFDRWCFHASLPQTGVTLQMQGLGPGSTPEEATVAAIIVTTPGHATPSGIMVGTPMSEVEELLGPPLTAAAPSTLAQAGLMKTPHVYSPGGWYLDFVPSERSEQHLGLRFVVLDGVVTELRAGLAGWTQLVEGCA